MLNPIMNLVSKIVFSGINGKSLIIPIIFLLYLMLGQAKEVIEVSKEILRG